MIIQTNLVFETGGIEELKIEAKDIFVFDR